MSVEYEDGLANFLQNIFIIIDKILPDKNLPFRRKKTNTNLLVALVRMMIDIKFS